MIRRLVLLPVMALASTCLTGCVAAAIPVLAGSAIISGKKNAARDNADTPALSPPAPAAAASDPAQTPLVAGPEGQPEGTEQRGFALFVRYARNLAATPPEAQRPLSAVLRSPTALDGQRRRCEAEQQPVVLIDLDPKGGLLAVPSVAEKKPGLALGLAVLREAGVEIVWLSDLPIEEAGLLRTALEQSGLDPRGQDLVSLRRDADDRKQLRKDSLADTACIIAIAGDERADFDERFKYLRTPDAGANLEPIIGDGWFLTEPIFPLQGPQGQ